MMFIKSRKYILVFSFVLMLNVCPNKTSGQTFFGERHIISNDLIDPVSVYKVDLDMDGDMDIVTGSSEDNKIAWYENLGNGFSAQKVLTHYAYELRVFYPFDKDCDGDMDIFIIHNYGTPEYKWLENENNYNENWVLQSAENPQVYNSVLDYNNTSYITADYNADGTLDMVNPNYYFPGNCEWNEFNSLSYYPDGLSNTDIRNVLYVDIDNDGLKDYLGVVHPGGLSPIKWKQNLGSGDYAPWSTLASGLAYGYNAAAGDIDGDGDIDLVSTAYYEDRVAVFYNNGNNVFSNPVNICDIIDRPFKVFCEDFDMDGDPDVFVCTKYNLIWLENENGDFSEPRLIDHFTWQMIGSISSLYNLRFFLFEDFDGDQDIDIVHLSRYGYFLSYYENYQLSVDSQPVDTSVCPGETLTLGTSSETAENFQWYVNNGSGFISLENNTQYEGVQTDSLTIINADESLSGNLYVCELSVSAGSIFTDTISLFVGDTIPPEAISQPGDQEIGNATGCADLLPDFTSMVNFTDNCDPSPVIVQTPAPGTEINGAVNDISITISDASGNTTGISFNVAVSDTTAPQISGGPANLEIPSAGNCMYILPDYTGELMVSDNCDPNPEILQNPPAGTEISDDQISVTLTASDDMGNSSLYEFTLVKTDNSAPVFISNPDDQVLTANNNCQALLPDYIPLCIIHDNCDANPVVQQIPPAGTIITGPVNNVQIIAEDETGNTSSISFNAEVQDTTPPLITSIFTDMMIGDSLACTVNLPDYTSLLDGYDNCDNPLIKEQQPLPGTPVSGPDNMIILSLADNSGNVSQVHFMVSVADTTAPVFLSSPGNQDVFANENCNYIIPDFINEISIHDLCDANPVITQSPAAGTVSDADTQFVQIMIEDQSGNQSIHGFSLTKQDTSRPEILSVPVDQVHFLNNQCEFEVPDLSDSIQAVDNCDGSLAILQTPAAGELISASQFNIHFNISDDAGNSVETDCLVTLIDSISPGFTGHLNDTIIGDAINCEHSLPDFSIMVSGNDNCDTNPQIVQDPPAGTLISGVTNEITLSLADASGNESLMQFNVAVMDTTAPAILLTPQAQTVYSDENCQYAMPDYSGLLMAEDNCSDTICITQTPVAGELISGVLTEVCLFATDNSGNVTQVSFNTLMLDTIHPEFVNPMSDQWLGNGLECEIPLPDFTRHVDFLDNCDTDPAIYQHPAAGLTIGGDTCVVSLTLIDESGNSNALFFDASVSDMTPPELSAVPGDQTLYADNNCLAGMPAYLADISITDNCDTAPRLSQHPMANNEITGSINTVFITGIDGSGNEISASFNIDVLDSIAPRLICSDTISINLINGQTYYEVQGNELDPVFFDNCHVAELSNDVNHYESLAGNIFTMGQHQVNWTATDASYNESQCLSTVIVNRPEGVLLAHGIAVYPNPNHGIFTIDFAGNEVEKLEIYNAIGQRIYEKGIPFHSEETIDISVYGSGMYVVRIHLPNDVVSDEIIVE